MKVKKTGTRSETKTKWLKIYCRTCDGKKTVEEKAYPTGEIIEVPCPECNGEGWVYAQRGVES